MMKRYEPIGGVSAEDAKQIISGLFLKETKLYAVLDYAVCFGIYLDGQFFVGLEGQTVPALLDWNYLRELRVFDEEQELLLIAADDGWSGRIRRNAGNEEEDRKAGEYTIEERHKLWGKAMNNTYRGIPGWTTLMSGRGSIIQIPEMLEKNEEAAICVYRYMRIPNVENEEELVYQKDIRMVKLCPWEGECEDGGLF